MKRSIAKLLVFMMVATTLFVPVGFSYAETDEVAQNKNVVTTDISDSTVDGQSKQTTNETADTETAVETVEEEMDFMFIESVELEAPGTQNIIISWDETLNTIDRMVLVLDSDEETLEIAEKERTDNSILFSKEFTASETGTYVIKNIKYYIGEEEFLFSLDDVEIKGDFKVVDNVKDSMEDNMASITVEGGDVAGSNVEEQISTLMNDAEVTTVQKSRSANGEIIVVLDPGHGSLEAGASGNGLKEHELNYKIAVYCKEELEQYQGVKVYLTHNGTGFSGTAAERMQKRIDIAKSYGADVLISLHINAVGGNGAEVWYPNANYKPEMQQVGKPLAASIQKELVALGLYDRGIKYRNTVEDRYADGSLQDYYGIIRRSKLAGIPGIIVEHAFIDNSSDVQNFLNSDAKLEKLGVADATGIANYFGISKESTDEIAEGTYKISSASDGKVVGVQDGALNNGTALIATDGGAELSSSQKFEIIKTAKGQYKILAEHSGKALTSGGTVVGQNEYKGGASQVWKFISTEDDSNSYIIKTGFNTYLTLNEDGSLIETADIQEAIKWNLEMTEYRPVEDGFYSISTKVDSGKCLEVSGASLTNGGNVHVYDGNKTLAQQFNVRYVSNGYYSITAEHSNKALDVASGSLKTGANVWQYSSNGTNAQLWKFLQAEDGSYYIKSKLGTVMKTGSTTPKNGTNVEMAAMSEDTAQKWNLTNISKTAADDTYLILSAKDNLRAMTQKNGNTQINVYENIKAQKYDIAYISNGYYKIVNKETGKVLEVAGSSKSIKANVREGTWVEKGNDNQLWRIADLGDGKYMIKSKLGTFIDVSSASMAENNNIWMYSFNGTAAQIWNLDSSRTEQPEQPIEDGTYIFKSALKSTSVIDISSGSLNNMTNVWLYTNNGTSAQRFEVSYVGNGYYNIISEKSAKSLDVANGSSKTGVNLWQYAKNGTEAQLWKFIDVGNGYYYIKSPKGTVVDVASAKTKDGTNIQMYSLNGTNAQKWKIQKSVYRPISESTYAFKSGLSNNRGMEVSEATDADGVNIQLGNAVYNDKQRFIVKYADDDYGYYKISPVNTTNKYLDVKDGVALSGANLQQYTGSDTDGQLWKFIDAGNGYYYIRSKLGTTIDVSSAKTAVGTNVQLYTMNGTNAQKWKPVQNELMPIMSTSDVTADQLAAYFNSKNKVYPYSSVSEAPTIRDFAQIYIEECAAEGVRADVAFCQAMKETGWLQFGGDVKSNQYNFAGLGATGNGNPGNSFESIRIGIRAHVQHLKAYACTDNLNQGCVDDRFKYVQRGVSPYVEWLGQNENPAGKGWATTSGYGYSIVNMVISLSYMNVLN